MESRYSALANFMVEDGFLSSKDFQVLRQEPPTSGPWFVKLASAMKLMPENEMLDYISRKSGCPRCPENIERIPEGCLDVIPMPFLEFLEVFPYELNGNQLRIAVADPMDKSDVEQLKAITGLKIEAAVASIGQIHTVLANSSPDFSPAKSELTQFLARQTATKDVGDGNVDTGLSVVEGPIEEDLNEGDGILFSSPVSVDNGMLGSSGEAEVFGQEQSDSVEGISDAASLFGDETGELEDNSEPQDSAALFGESLSAEEVSEGASEVADLFGEATEEESKEAASEGDSEAADLFGEAPKAESEEVASEAGGVAELFGDAPAADSSEQMEEAAAPAPELLLTTDPMDVSAIDEIPADIPMLGVEEEVKEEAAVSDEGLLSDIPMLGVEEAEGDSGVSSDAEIPADIPMLGVEEEVKEEAAVSDEGLLSDIPMLGVEEAEGDSGVSSDAEIPADIPMLGVEEEVKEEAAVSDEGLLSDIPMLGVEEVAQEEPAVSDEDLLSDIPMLGVEEASASTAPEMAEVENFSELPEGVEALGTEAEEVPDLDSGDAATEESVEELAAAAGTESEDLPLEMEAEEARNLDSGDAATEESVEELAAAAVPESEDLPLEMEAEEAPNMDSDDAGTEEVAEELATTPAPQEVVEDPNTRNYASAITKASLAASPKQALESIMQELSKIDVEATVFVDPAQKNFACGLSLADLDLSKNEIREVGFHILTGPQVFNVEYASIALAVNENQQQLWLISSTAGIFSEASSASIQQLLLVLSTRATV
jgi:hypothetical protein